MHGGAWCGIKCSFCPPRLHIACYRVGWQTRTRFLAWTKSNALMTTGCRNCAKQSGAREEQLPTMTVCKFLQTPAHWSSTTSVSRGILHLLSFWLKHMERISQPAKPADMTPLKPSNAYDNCGKREKILSNRTTNQRSITRTGSKSWKPSRNTLPTNALVLPRYRRLLFATTWWKQVPVHASDPLTA